MTLVTRDIINKNNSIECKNKRLFKANGKPYCQQVSQPS